MSESAVTRNPEAVIRALHGCKDLGVRLTLDDYGTGSASLSDLKRLPVDSLKIHESFVDGLGQQAEAASLVGALVDLGHALGLEVAAEGVETDVQLAQLRELGCDRAQGFVLGRAVPGDEVRALLTPA